MGDRGTRTVSTKMREEYFTVFEGRKSEAVKFCPECHDEVHKAANQWARKLNPKHRGRVEPPEVLYLTTRVMVERHKPAVYKDPVYDSRGNLMRLLGCDAELF